MILDELAAAARYHALHPGLATGLAALARPGLAELPAGRHELDGARLYLIVGRDAGRGRDASPLEAHRRYIDIQLAIAGREEIGWKPAGRCQHVSTEYDADRDIMFFADQPESWITLPPGKFMIFFPGDAHAPLAGDGALHKAVVKVAVDWQAA